jgi:hypothetical protein
LTALLAFGPALLLRSVLPMAHASAATARQTPAAQQPPSCDAEEHRQFDFWIGDWQVTTPDGQPAGTNRIESILNGCVLLENWTGRSGSIGKSFNMYDRRAGRWRQTWVDGAGGRLDLVGGLDGGAMVLGGTTPAPDGGEVLHEIRWERFDEGKVRQHWRMSRDGGKSWSDAFVGIYARAE